MQLQAIQRVHTEWVIKWPALLTAITIGQMTNRFMFSVLFIDLAYKLMACSTEKHTRCKLGKSAEESRTTSPMACPLPQCQSILNSCDERWRTFCDQPNMEMLDQPGTPSFKAHQQIPTFIFYFAVKTHRWHQNGLNASLQRSLHKRWILKGTCTKNVASK